MGSGSNAVSALHSPVTVTFHHGVAQVSLRTGTGSVGSQAELLAQMAGSATAAHLTLTVVRAQPATQAGYRVYTPSGGLVTGLNPLWDNTPTEAFAAEVTLSLGAVSAPITFNDRESNGGATVTKSPGVLRGYASVPGRAIMLSPVNQATGPPCGR